MTKLSTFFQLLKSNGLLWALLYLAERIFGESFKQKRITLEIKDKLPGFNTVQYNHKEWSNYNWSQEGEEWSDSEAWKKSLLNEVLLRYIQPNKIVLEIGPGAGRWSVILAPLSQKFILVDLTEASIQHCKKKLQQFTNCVFYANNGSDLSFLKNESVDYVWSFDVFVHISPSDTELYLKALYPVLVKDGIGIIHHPAEGGFKGGFRSSTTNELFCALLKKYNFEIVLQFDSWGENHSVREFKDMITVFRKT